MLQNDVDVELMAMLCCCLMFPRLETIYREKLWQHFRTNDQDRRYNFKHKTNGPYTKCFLSVLLFRDGVRHNIILHCDQDVDSMELSRQHRTLQRILLARSLQQAAVADSECTLWENHFLKWLKLPRSSALLREEKGAILITDDCADPNL